LDKARRRALAANAVRNEEKVEYPHGTGADETKTPRNDPAIVGHDGVRPVSRSRTLDVLAAGLVPRSPLHERTGPAGDRLKYRLSSALKGALPSTSVGSVARFGTPRPPPTPPPPGPPPTPPPPGHLPPAAR
jgi:hypothetical protein